MTYYKNYIILFGGFQDTSQQTKYLQDLWIYDCTSFTWHEPKLPPATAKPDARSSCSLLPHAAGAVLYGGYSRVKAVAKASNAKQSKSGANSKNVLKPMIHQDGWFLQIASPASDAPSNTLPTVRWQRRKRPANAPNPQRAGATMCSHIGRGIQFGGVYDVEESEEGIESEFFNQLFAFNVDRNRYASLALRRPRAAAKKPITDRGRRDRGKQAEEDLLANLKALEMKHPESAEDPNNMDWDASTVNEDQELTDKPEKPVVFELPHPRFNAQLAVQRDVLYIFWWHIRKRAIGNSHLMKCGRLTSSSLTESERSTNESSRIGQGSDEDESEEEEDDDDVEMSDEEPGSGDESAILSPTSTVAPEDAFKESVPKEEEATEELVLSPQ